MLFRSFPTWLAPVQVQIIPVSLSVHADYAKKVEDSLRMAGIRVEVDVREEKLGYKIREAQTKKIPFALVLGDKEMESDEVNIRRYGQKETETMSLDEFVTFIQQEVTEKVSKK